MSRFESVSSIVQRHWQQEFHDRRVAQYGKPVVETETRDPRPVSEWSDGKLMAILMILRSATAKDCIAHWSGSGVRASQYDFRDLRQEGLAFRRQVGSFHELTDDGQRFAADACVLVAKRFGLHHIEYRNTSDSVSARCTCGFRASFLRKNFQEDNNLTRAVNRHLADPDEHGRQRAAVSAAIDKTLTRVGGDD